MDETEKKNDKPPQTYKYWFYKLRTTFYVFVFLLFVAVSLKSCDRFVWQKPINTTVFAATDDEKAFPGLWPPDWVPHTPVFDPPKPPPKKDSPPWKDMS